MIPRDLDVITLVPTKYFFITLRPRQNGRHFADAIFKCIFSNQNAWISLKITLKFVPKVRINNIPALVQIMAWRRPGDKPLSEPMMVLVYWRIYASLGLNELYNQCSTIIRRRHPIAKTWGQAVGWNHELKVQSKLHNFGCSAVRNTVI